jgi:5S rRNA maturation endonuclease (ribonuclease M5)
MPMRDLDQWLAKLVEEKPLIVVEGPKDKASLHKLGLENVLTLRGRPLYKLVERIAAETKECIVLTDLDEEGKNLYARLRSDLQKHGVRIDDRFRHFLFKETDLRQIEGLFRYIRRHSQTI